MNQWCALRGVTGPVVMGFIAVIAEQADVDRGQQGEHQRLNQADEAAP